MQNEQPDEIDFRAEERTRVSQQALQDISEITQQLANTELVTGGKKRLEEHIFRNVFLPMFLGQPNPNLEQPIKIGNWVAYAGSPHAEVDVVDAHGKVLFTVPPAYDAMSIRPTDFEGGPGGVKYVIQQTQLLADSRPVQAANFAHAELTKVATVMKSSDTDKKAQYAATWNKIFQFYGVTVGTATAAQKTSPDQPTSDPDYEIVAP